MEGQQPLVYRIKVALVHLGVSRTTLYQLVNTGELKLVKLGPRASAITAESVRAFLGKGGVSSSRSGR